MCVLDRHGMGESSWVADIIWDRQVQEFILLGVVTAKLHHRCIATADSHLPPTTCNITNVQASFSELWMEMLTEPLTRKRRKRSSRLHQVLQSPDPH